jgi:hypothetical protein
VPGNIRIPDYSRNLEFPTLILSKTAIAVGRIAPEDFGFREQRHWTATAMLGAKPPVTDRANISAVHPLG